MTETAQFLLAIGATGAVCALWAWLQISGAPEDGSAARTDDTCTSGKCEVCRGLGRYCTTTEDAHSLGTSPPSAQR